MKKAFLMAQPFYYIFAIILIALILFFGYNVINNLINLNEQGKFVTFKSDLTKTVNDIYYKNPGSIIQYSKTSTHKPLLLPRDVKEVCFTSDGKVTAKSKYFQEFTVENLVPIVNCITTINNELSFILENKIINNKIKVEINEITS